VAIARAVVRRPALLLADEPTGNLDSQNAGIVLDLLADLNRTDGLTVVMITHNEHLVDRADRVLVMRDGRFVS
jgi:ABC-type lipoprotein export system ATPase subunit